MPCLYPMHRLNVAEILLTLPTLLLVSVQVQYARSRPVDGVVRRSIHCLGQSCL